MAGRIAHSAAYSISRLGVNSASALLVPVALRALLPNEAQTFLLMLAVVTLGSNASAAWLEQVLYRFSARSLRQQISTIIKLECLLTILVLSPLVYYWIRSGFISFSGSDTVLIVAANLMIVADMIYRVIVVTLQVSDQDRLLISANVYRLVLEVAAGTGALVLANSAVTAIAAVSVARALSVLAVCQFADFAKVISSSHGSPVNSNWRSYGLAMAVWFWSLLLLQYAPSFLSASYQGPRESAAFLGGYRLMMQIGLLTPALLLLYVQPKLMGCYQREGLDAFYELWSRWFARYIVLALLSVAAIGLGLPVILRLGLSSTYAQFATGMSYLLPAFGMWAVANYIQKILEVGLAAWQMATDLGASVIVFFGCFFWYQVRHAGIEHFPAVAAVGFSVAVSAYTILVCKHALEHLPTMFAGIRHMVLGTLCVASISGVVLAGRLAFLVR